MVEAFGEPPQQRFAPVPVVERRLQGGGDGVGGREPRQVGGDDDEAAVTAALEGR
jgi:hypothetical protein